MEKTINTEFILNITKIKKITVEDGKSIVLVDSKEYGIVEIIFENVWDCRYTIENGIIDRGTSIIHEEKIKNSIYEVKESRYIDYFKKQVSGTRSIDKLKDYILYDEIDGFSPIIINGNLDLIDNNRGRKLLKTKEE